MGHFLSSAEVACCQNIKGGLVARGSTLEDNCILMQLKWENTINTLVFYVKKEHSLSKSWRPSSYEDKWRGLVSSPMTEGFQA